MKWYLIVVWFAFPQVWMKLSIFSAVYWLFACFLWRNVQVIGPLVNWIFCLFEFMRSLCILDINLFSDKWFANICSHSVVGCLFINNVLWNTKIFNFDEVQLSHPFLCCLCFWCHIQESTDKTEIVKIYLWKEGSRGRGYMYTYGWFTLMYGRNQHNMVKQLSFRKKTHKIYLCIFF